ncbi:MAG: tripartite tricarboxylate transporter permease, partial [Phycisphaeraceae bacterium]
LTQQGRGGFALGISATASALGSLIGAVVLILLIPVVRSVILSVSFPEYTMLIVMGLAAIALASRGSMIKGLVSGSVGLSLSFVGFSPMGGELRYVFGQQALVGGIGVIAVLIGLFAVSEVIRLLVDNEAIAEQASEIKFGFGQVFEGVVYTVKQPWLLIRSSVLGTALGIIPAVGGTVAAFMAYFQASQTSRDGTFGHGDPRGSWRRKRPTTPRTPGRPCRAWPSGCPVVRTGRSSWVP